MKNYFKLTKLVVCLLAITIFSSCNSNDVKRGFIGRIVDLNCNKRDSVVSIVKEVGQSSLAEHRVYYFDNSRSMIRTSNMINGRTLLDVLKDSLYQTVDALPIGTIVEVIVFSDYAWWQKSQENASDYFPMADQMCSLHIENKMTDKTKMLNFIKNISAIGKLSETVHYDTHHSIAINDFLNRRQLKGYVNTMYLLTDGDDEYDHPRGRSANIESGISVLESRWKNNVSRDMHGIYVALNEEEFELGTYNEEEFELGTYFKNRPKDENRHLYHVSGCNTRINLFSIEDTICIDNALLPHNICLRTSGDSPHNISISSNDKFYVCTLESFNSLAKEVKLRIEPKTSNLPLDHNVKIEMKLDWGNKSKSNGKINLPSNSLPLIVRCKVPKTGIISVATPVQMQNTKIKFRRDKVFWEENNPDTLVYDMRYILSENITNQSNTLPSPDLLIDFGDANDYIKLLDAQGIAQSTIGLPIAKDTTITFAITIDKNHGNLQRRQTLHGKIALNNLTNVDALYLGKKQIKKHNDSYVLVDDFELEIKQRWELWIWCLVTLLLLLALIVIAIIIYFIMCYKKAAKFPGDSGQSIVFTGIGLDSPMGFAMVPDDFLVESLAANAIKTHKLSSKFVQKIVVHNGHFKEYRPSFWEKHTKGDIIYLTSNNFIDGIMEKIEITPIGKKQNFVAQFDIFKTTNSQAAVQPPIVLALGQLNTVNSQVNYTQILNYNLAVMGSILI